MVVFASGGDLWSENVALEAVGESEGEDGKALGSFIWLRKASSITI